tara:strand:+ start:1972 stop:2475 length:504 start_codon:yes stop_codon:yes gene_type:complete
MIDELIIGDQDDCVEGSEELPVVHACKFPCYMDKIKPTKSYPKHDKRYLWVSDENNLYLNLVDSRVPRFQLDSFFEFIKFGRGKRKILIHCNKGRSRSVALAILLYSVDAEEDYSSFREAKDSFERKFPEVPRTPSRGIQFFLSKNWGKIQEYHQRRGRPLGKEESE